MPDQQDPRIARLLAGMTEAATKHGSDPKDAMHVEVVPSTDGTLPKVVFIAPILQTGLNIINKEGRPYVTTFFTLEQFDELVLSLVVAMNDLRKKYPRPPLPKEPGPD